VEPQDSPIVPGAAIGRFLVMKKLGEGTFSRVYLARDPRLPDEPSAWVAVKVPRSQLFRDAEMQLRLLRELQIVSRLRSDPGICRFIETGMALGTLFFAYEYVAGETLQEWMMRHPQRSLGVVLHLVRDVARSMAQVHDQAVVHRDLKPANIMLRPSELGRVPSGLQPVILDFGLARGDRQRELQLTVTGQRLGTPAYFSPEVARGETVRARNATDIYSLGAILYELLVGRPPFEGHGVQLVEQIEQAPVVAPSHRDPRLHPDLDACCLQALAKDPADRFEESMHRFAAEIDRLLHASIPLDLAVPASPNQPAHRSAWGASTADFRPLDPLP
jgi:serine/threonine protein kinase